MRIRTFVLASIVFLAGCQSTQTGTSSNTDHAFVSAEFVVSLDNPVGWEQKSHEGVLVVFLSPDEGPADEFRENVNLVTEPAQGHSADEYSQAVRQIMEKTVTDYKVTRTGTMMIDGQTALWREHTSREGQYRLKVRQVYIVKNDIAYSLTYSAMEDSFDKFLEDALKIISTLQIK